MSAGTATRQTISSATKLPYTVGKATDLGFDPSGGAWTTICETHKAVLNSANRASARAAVDHPEWCAGCLVLLRPQTKGTMGGWRPGAGRKPMEGGRVNVWVRPGKNGKTAGTYSVTPAHVEMIERYADLRTDENDSRALREMIETAYATLEKP